MKLYKYVSLEAATAILEKQTIGFSRASFFNDPFDTPISVPVPTGTPIEGVFANSAADVKSQIWEANTGILSLTRTPTNSLMWAHYADGHRGVVLAINVNTAGFLKAEANMIPAHFGSVAYTRYRPSGPYYSQFSTGIAVGQVHEFLIDHFEKWQRMFLMKPLDWAYEEEVRVAKCLGGLSSSGGTNASGAFDVLEVGGRPLHCFHLPNGSIEGLFFGARVSNEATKIFQDKYATLEFKRAKLDQNRFAVGLDSL